MRAGADVGEEFEVDQVNAVHVAHPYVDVARQRQVDQHERTVDAALAARFENRLDVRRGDHQAGRAGARDHQVGGGQRVLEGGHRHGPAADLVGQVLGALVGAVGDEDRAHALALQRGRGERAHRPGADDERAAPADVPADQLGLFEADGDQGLARAVDVGLAVRALADPQRLLRQVVEDAARRVVLLGERE